MLNQLLESREFIAAMIGVLIATLRSGQRTIYGIGADGVTRTVTGTVLDKHVDYSILGSSYLVTTLINGVPTVLEVDNSWRLGVSDADVLFGVLERGKSYAFETRGERVVGPFIKAYPFIVRATLETTAQANPDPASGG